MELLSLIVLSFKIKVLSNINTSSPTNKQTKKKQNKAINVLFKALNLDDFKNLNCP